MSEKGTISLTETLLHAFEKLSYWSINRTASRRSFMWCGKTRSRFTLSKSPCFNIMSSLCETAGLDSSTLGYSDRIEGFWERIWVRGLCFAEFFTSSLPYFRKLLSNPSVVEDKMLIGSSPEGALGKISGYFLEGDSFKTGVSFWEFEDWAELSISLIGIKWSTFWLFCRYISSSIPIKLGVVFSEDFLEFDPW